MADYAIGDIQGCYRQLMQLLHHIEYNSKHDRLWLLGDVVNRGPDSLQVLRFLHQTPGVTITLGNHDLHLLAVHFGASEARNKDTFSDVLSAADRDVLCDFLLKQPIIAKHDEYLMVHAGIAPLWSEQQAIDYAREVEAILQGPERMLFFAAMYGDEPRLWEPQLQGPERWRLITNYCTRMRYCDKQGGLELACKRGPKQAPEHCYPWFKLHNRKAIASTILFGHWAALEGHVDVNRIYGLDTGCVWGGALTALRLQDKQLFRV